MVAYWVIIGCVAVPLLLWQIFDPRGMWQATQAWKYRNPEANEPSDEAHGFTQAGAVFGVVVLIVAGLMLTGLDNADSSRTSASKSSSASSSKRPPLYETKSERREVGPGTIIGYDHPSELTLRLVVLNTRSLSIDGGCSSVTGVYEHSNAIVVSVTRWEDSDREGVYRHRCTDEFPGKPTVVRRSLKEPLGDRPILTAATTGDAKAHGLAPGPEIRPVPLKENPRPGVQQPLTWVSIDPAWVPVPLIAGVNSVSRY
ncbi:hypothetical protein FOV72_20835 [Gordonia rubripertincta]|uniref:hypothetical protein n=1 Tax=Gordonia rubripertincta TaxID=36822 RepID=UPI00117F7921|nr:hypothetical protein [Gordonia rubripertincta]TSD93098.1 hypothetical protein FOV72_20835 [Gordonia rubripertincta]